MGTGSLEEPGMSPRARLAIAAQAIAVAVLVAIIYATLLQPDEGGDLSGIQAPDGGRAQLRAPDAEDKRAERRGGDARAVPGSTVAGGGLARNVGGPYRYWWRGAGGAAGTQELVSTPSDHQYGDAVGELLKRVGD
jgi:hypothetical protein